MTASEHQRTTATTVSRLEVEGGFLDGLNLELTPGLNVLIGERGTGKTSVVELLRYALGAGSLVEGDSSRQERARSVLGDGVVHVELRGPSGSTQVSRTHRDRSPRASGSLPLVSVVGQGEMEVIGLEAAGRLRLLDRYARHRADEEGRRASSALAGVRSSTVQLKQIREDFRRVNEQLEDLEEVPTVLAEAIKEQEEGLQSVNATRAETEQLERLQRRVERLRRLVTQVSGATSVAAANQVQVHATLEAWRPLPLPNDDGSASDWFGKAKQAADDAKDALTFAGAHAQTAVTALKNVQELLDGEVAELDRRTKEQNSSR